MRTNDPERKSSPLSGFISTQPITLGYMNGNFWIYNTYAGSFFKMHLVEDDGSDRYTKGSSELYMAPMLHPNIGRDVKVKYAPESLSETRHPTSFAHVVPRSLPRTLCRQQTQNQHRIRSRKRLEIHMPNMIYLGRSVQKTSQRKP